MNARGQQNPAGSRTRSPDAAGAASAAAVCATEARGAISVGVAFGADRARAAELASAYEAVALVLALGVAATGLTVSGFVSAGAGRRVADQTSFAVAVDFAGLAAFSRRALPQAAQAAQAIQVEVAKRSDGEGTAPVLAGQTNHAASGVCAAIGVAHAKLAAFPQCLAGAPVAGKASGAVRVGRTRAAGGLGRESHAIAALAHAAARCDVADEQAGVIVEAGTLLVQGTSAPQIAALVAGDADGFPQHAHLGWVRAASHEPSSKANGPTPPRCFHRFPFQHDRLLPNPRRFLSFFREE